MTRYRSASQFLVCLTLIGILGVAQADVFERVFGVSRTLDPAKVAEAKALKPGETLSVDADGDGTIDELWYMDRGKRHTKEQLLVRVIDEDGDLSETGRGDRDSDLYLWDWGADGTIDVATDYQDNDGDNDLDEMGIFYKKNWSDDLEDITVWWGVDVGDDNLLWYDVDGTYYQDLCQYRTHFSGDEMFYQYRLAEGWDEWLNVFEDPFAFYDPDGDQCSEVVVRVCAKGHEVENLRYSIDADGDAYGSRTHNYDFSVTAIPGDSPVSTEGIATQPATVRGIPTHPVLSWEDTRGFAQKASWSKAMLSWNELNANTDGDIAKDSHERWEGVLNHKSKHDDFPQVGGPPTSAYNTRVEVSHKPVSPLRLYFDETDQRLHLLGAAYGYIDVDYNLDGTVDAAYEYEDQNGDGVLDRRRIDTDGDGTFELEFAMSGNAGEIALEYEPVLERYKPTLDKVLRDTQEFIDAAEAILESNDERADAIKAYFLNELPNWHREREVGLYVRTSPAGARFYLDLVRDRLFAVMKERYGAMQEWPEFEQSYASGDIGAATAIIRRHADELSYASAARRFGGFTKRIPIAIDNSGQPERERSPIVLSIAAIEEAAPDFNANNCAIVAPQRWLDWFELPHQVDELNSDTGQELSFVSDLPADSKSTFYLYYSPEGQREVTYPQYTRAVLETPAYVAWESDAGAYRFYTGQFDFFGKEPDRGLPREERLLYPIVEVAYHDQQEWGMDALHVDYSSGLGGVTMRLDGQDYLVQSPAGEGHVAFSHRVLADGPVRAAIAIRAENVVPGNPDISAEFVCLIYTGHAESEIRCKILGVDGPIELAPGLVKLGDESWFKDEDAGILANYGYQEYRIGDIALALIVPPDLLNDTVDLEDERRLLCDAPEHSLRYWVIGDWRRGRQYPVSPTIDNWRFEVEALAKTVTQEPAIALGKVETTN
ncbi:MAG: hypothetical protein AMXMBFR82_23230 [Candidatus Hydrogenedentota bacterium]